MSTYTFKVKRHNFTYKNVEISTPYQLKHWHELMNPDSFYFTRDTMKFFGDTMKNYGLRKHADCFELHRKNPVNGGLQTSSFFDVKTLKRVIK